VAIVVLVLWLFTAGAGLYLLLTSNLARPAEPSAVREPAAVPVPATPGAESGGGAPVGPAALGVQPAGAKRRDRFETPSLAAARSAPMIPGVRSLLEFAHPACGIIGLGCWLGFTLIHDRALGWIAFALVAATAALGLSWLAANARPAASKPSFPPRFIALHGAAAAVTVTLAALAAFAVIS
jgi:hypothetical protein